MLVVHIVMGGALASINDSFTCVTRLTQESFSPPPMRVYAHCNALQRTATHCNTLQHTAAVILPPPDSSICPLQDTATHCNTLQHTATHCNTLQHTPHTTTHCNTLQQQESSSLPPIRVYVLGSRDDFLQVKVLKSQKFSKVRKI